MFSSKTKATWFMCKIKDELYTTHYALISICAFRVKSYLMNKFKKFPYDCITLPCLCSSFHQLCRLLLLT